MHKESSMAMKLLILCVIINFYDLISMTTSISMRTLEQ